ncbi:hypothetical protein QMK33_02445 [Hymenobacter sp. H14-R3]|uniref:hypothetical protein n=1 Tax=Hymenobacter sp. H14-R3 TaxID=3046308 RepID=UPI0024B93EC3|nr:hypothetical protein [Hymenobacter sp. H14-R3]MDJ0363997.1 hypothetical protein [Hymenobacter sp. H14-R3]
MKATLLLAALLALGPALARAQSGPVLAPAHAATQLSGPVLDAAGRPRPGANVFLKSTFDGAMAAADWLPRYYQAYALIGNVFQSKEDADAKDKTLDRAEAALALKWAATGRSCSRCKPMGTRRGWAVRSCSAPSSI